MYLKEVSKAKNADEALRIFKQEHPTKSATGDIFAANGRTCYGVILNQYESKDDIVNFYGVAKAIRPIRNWEKFYSEKITVFETNHPNTEVLLSVGGIKMFYIFITITGDVADITDEEIKQAFSLSLVEKR